MKKIVSIALTAALLIPFAAGCKNAGGGGETFGYKTSDGLLQTGPKQQRWLSIPDSRLVINPYNFEGAGGDVTELMYSSSPAMPLNIGYLDPYINESRGRYVGSVVELYETAVTAGAGPEEAFRPDYAFEEGWKYDRKELELALSAEDGTAVMTLRPDAPYDWAWVTLTADVDFDKNPYFNINVPECRGRWAVKVAGAGISGDIAIKPDNNETGMFSIDMAAAINADPGLKEPLTGVKKIEIRIFVVIKDSPLTFSGVSVMYMGGRFITEAAEYNTEWLPYALNFTASYPNGLKLSGQDFFADEKTVVRRVEVLAPGRFCAAAGYKGSAAADGPDTLVFNSEGYKCALTFNNSKPGAVFGDNILSFYENHVYMAAGAGKKDRPVTNGAYMLDFGEVEAGDVFVFAFALDTAASETAAVTADSRAAADIGNAGAAISARRLYWDEYLKKVPIPRNFALSNIDTRGVTPDEVERLYYISWIFMAQAVLPSNPELGYPYRQVSCGKPSMWGYGHALSSYSATFESFFGMWALAYTMPDEAWDSFLGIMSLVDEQGVIGGESICSEKAHTALLLYNATGDAEKLGSVFGALERYLTWRMDNPRWIFSIYTPNVNQKDSDFVVSLLRDIDFMQEICAILEKPDRLVHWKAARDKMSENYEKWFFDGHDTPMQYYDAATGQAAAGWTLWVSKGMVLDNLSDKCRDMLMGRFSEEYDPAKSFSGMNMVKYQCHANLTYGLIQYGYADTAREMIQAAVRDVVISGIFAEVYHPGIPITVEGVRPSANGAAIMIDYVMAMNGFLFQWGGPAALNLFGDAAVDNIRMKGKVLNLSVADGKAKLSGSFIGKGAAVFDVPEDSFARYSE